MKLAVSIPVLNQQSATQRAFSSLKRLQKDKHSYIIIDNGSTPPVRDWLIGLEESDMVIKNDENKGLPKALNQAMNFNEKVVKADYVFHTHTDIEMFEQDWDAKTLKSIEEASNVGVAGFYGAMGIGTPDIYKTDYNMAQLIRTTPISGNKCKIPREIHHQIHFEQDWKECAVLDGFSLITHKDLRFETNFGPHHMYDNDICLQAIDKGQKVITINMDINHYGGMTDVGEDWATKFGKTKQQVHQEAHPPFYNKWRHLLPVRK